MAELKAVLDDSYFLMLESFKPVAENLVEDAIDFDTYVNLVIHRGIRGMIEDIVPRDPDVLLHSIQRMYEANPEFVASFINNVLNAGGAREEARERLGFIREK